MAGTRRGRWAATLALPALALGAASASGFFGEPDPTFGGDGVVLAAGAGAGGEADDVVVLPDGAILAAGSVLTATGGSDVAVFKLEENGSLDSTFGGGDGIAVVDIDGDASADKAYAIALQGDGKIVVAGSTRADAPGADEDLAIARFESDGTLDDDDGDGGFGGDGIVTVPVSATTDDWANSVVVDASGRVTAAGTVWEGSTVDDYQQDFLLVRLTSAGALDPNFDGDAGPGNGIVRVSFASGDFAYEEAFGVGLADDGDLIAVGEVYNGDTLSDTLIGVARLNAADGGLDSAFDDDGLVTTQVGDAHSVALDLAVSDGTVAVAGQSGSNLMLARYAQADGSLDDSFGDAGVVTVAPAQIGADQLTGGDIAVDGDRYVVALQIGDSTSGEDVGVAAFSGDGQLDSDFAEDGIATLSTAPPGGLERAFAVAPVDDGNALTQNKVVIAGEASPDEPENFAALFARFGPDITPPATTITRPKAGKTRDRTPSLRFTVSEPGTSRCRIDAKPWIENCTSPRTFPRQPLGAHVIKVQSTDLDGNIENPPARRRFKIVR